MPTPLHLSDEEMDVLLGQAAPIAYGRRDEFLQAVAAAVAQTGNGAGVGLVHRVARERSKLTRRAKLDRGGGAWPKPPRRTVVTSEKQPETSPHAAFGLASCRGRDMAVKFDPAGQRSARHRLPI
jgi:hypothetical protein